MNRGRWRPSATWTRNDPLRPDPRPQKRLLTAPEAAEYLGLAVWTIRQWASQGRIPKVKLGKALRFDVEDLDRMIAKSKIPAGALSRNLRDPTFPS